MMRIDKSTAWLIRGTRYLLATSSGEVRRLTSSRIQKPELPRERAWKPASCQLPAIPGPDSNLQLVEFSQYFVRTVPARFQACSTARQTSFAPENAASPRGIRCVFRARSPSEPLTYRRVYHVARRRF